MEVFDPILDSLRTFGERMFVIDDEAGRKNRPPEFFEYPLRIGRSIFFFQPRESLSESRIVLRETKPLDPSILNHTAKITSDIWVRGVQQAKDEVPK